MRYSKATQISRDNVGDLEVAWTHHSGDVSDGSDGTSRTSFNVTPLLVDDTLVFCTPMNRVIAVDAETGRGALGLRPRAAPDEAPRSPQPRLPRRRLLGGGFGRRSAGAACGRRIFTATVDSELIAIDATNGEVCAGFGREGRVDLHVGMGEVEPWAYYVTSPPVTLNDTVAVGGMVYDNLRREAPPGVIRGFDARTGERRWAFDPVPPGYDGPPPAEGSEFVPGTANSWSILSADEELDLVFVPMGNAATDYFAGSRYGLDEYSSSVLALRGATGELVWHYRMVNKDVWDFDTASQPVLFDFEKPDGSRVPALAQGTKMGHVFVLDRRTGVPIHGHEEVPVPTDGVPGEVLAPTQPVPTFVEPLHPSELTPGRRLRLHVLGSQRLPRRDREVPLRRHVHAADRRRAASSTRRTRAA